MLRKLRPQLEQVMWQEQELAALGAKLQEAEWEARSYADKEAPLQAQAQQVRYLVIPPRGSPSRPRRSRCVT